MACKSSTWHIAGLQKFFQPFSHSKEGSMVYWVSEKEYHGGVTCWKYDTINLAIKIGKSLKGI